MFGLGNDTVDDRLFFSNLSLRYAKDNRAFTDLIRAQQYKDASEYLHEEVYGKKYYGADLFNSIDQRLYDIEIYATQVAETTKARVIYDSYPPSDVEEGMMWVD